MPLVQPQFFGFGGSVHHKIVVLQQPPPLFHVVRFQNLLPDFLNRQFRGIDLTAIQHRIIAVVDSVVPALIGGLDGKITLAAQLPCALFVLCLNFRGRSRHGSAP